MERAIQMLPKSSHFTPAYNQLAGLALLLSASLQRIGMRLRVAFGAFISFQLVFIM
jgi:hypothetical protein